VTTILVIVAGVLCVLGLAGCLLPIVPGPPLNFAAVLLLGIASDFAPPLDGALLTILGGVTLAVAAADYVIPIMGAKKFGASRAGVWGSLLGMLLGLFFFAPVGLVLGALLGAVLGELAAGKKEWAALRAGVGVVLGSLLGVVIKLCASGVMTYYTVRAVLQLL
jgi:uncharacterized protein YqgC (DUF456 family)